MNIAELIEAGQYHKAIEELKGAIVIDPDEAELWQWLGYSFLQVGLAEQAVDALSRADQLQVGNSVTLRNLVTALIEAGRSEEAIKICKEWVEREPCDPRPLSALADANRGAGRFSRAADAAKAAIQAGDDSTETSLKLAGFLTEADRLREAIENYGELIHRNPECTEGLRGMGYAYSLEAEWSKAADLFRRAMALEPADAADHAHLGNCHLALKEWTEAALHFEKGIELGATEAVMHAGAGEALARLGEFEESAEHYRRVLALDSEFFVQHPEHRELLDLAEGHLFDQKARKRSHRK